MNMRNMMVLALLAGVASDACIGDQIRALEVDSFLIPESEGIRMMRIPSGSFIMGSPDDEVARGEDEVQHRVTISKPFYMAETPITQDQYLPVMVPDYEPLFVRAAHYEHSLPEVHQGGPLITESRHLAPTGNNPMDGVTWSKAVEFCDVLTRTEREAGRLPEGYVYRLPTEAEWEYACRAGTEGAFNVEGELRHFCWGPNVGNLKWTAPVKGKRMPNAWGLYDMHGNVYEWCHDWYGPYASSSSTSTEGVTDPTGPAEGDQKVARGGSWLSGQPQEGDESDAVRLRFMRSAARNRFPPERPLRIIGFRPVLAPAMDEQGE